MGHYVLGNRQTSGCYLLLEWLGVLGLVLDLVTNARCSNVRDAEYVVSNGFIITPRRSLSSPSHQAALLLV